MPPMIVLQHNCAGVGQAVVAAMESGVEIGADLILLQEEKRGKDSMRSHGTFIKMDSGRKEADQSSSKSHQQYRSE